MSPMISELAAPLDAAAEAELLEPELAALEATAVTLPEPAWAVAVDPPPAFWEPSP